MEKAYALVNVRDINLVCQHYKTYAQIEGRARRRKITRARRRKGCAGYLAYPFQKRMLMTAQPVLFLYNL